MKHVVLLCDGMADYPIPKWDGNTPMTIAKKPLMNELASKGTIGLVRTVADGLKPGSDVANLSVMGYDPMKYYTGRSPLEAASIGIAMQSDDIALRCNLVTVSEGEPFAEKTILDYCADDISTAEGTAIIESLKAAFDDADFTYYSGVSYRHCLIWQHGAEQLGTLTPPHDITGKPIHTYLPSHPNAAPLYKMMEQSFALLKDHPVNVARKAKGLRPANAIWLWGEGKSAQLPDFQQTNGVSGAVISAVDLIKGIGLLANMEVIEVEGATGYIDTNFTGKAQATIETLKKGTEFVYLHIEAPDECGHRAEYENKVKSLEIIDQQILRPIVEYLEQTGEDYKIMILPDHATPLALKTHVSDPVPFLIYQKSKATTANPDFIFDEVSATAANYLIEDGPGILKQFLT